MKPADWNISSSSLSQHAEKKNEQICGKLTINLAWKKKILYFIGNQRGIIIIRR